MRPNPVKRNLAKGGAAYGSEISRFRSDEVPGVYARAGLDFVFIDTEHTTFNRETVADMIRAARASKIVPVVRVPQAEYAFVAGYLDLGAQGVIVPRVNTPEEVERIVSWTRYPPVGIRGFACTPNQSDDKEIAPADFIARNHDDTLVVIQIERYQAIENLEAMLAIHGVDVACLGYMDLSVDMGIPGQIEHSKMVAAIERLIEVSDRLDVAPGIIHPELGVLETWIERGMRFVSHATDSILLERAARDAAVRLRAMRRPGKSEASVARSRGEVGAP